VKVQQRLQKNVHRNGKVSNPAPLKRLALCQPLSRLPTQFQRKFSAMPGQAAVFPNTHFTDQPSFPVCQFSPSQRCSKIHCCFTHITIKKLRKYQPIYLSHQFQGRAAMGTPDIAVMKEAASSNWATEAVAKQRAYFESGATRSYEFRLAQLKKLKKSVIDYKEELERTLAADLGRPPFETYAESVTLIEEINYTIKNLKKWMKPKKVKTTLAVFPGSSRVEYTPLGVTFVMGPYNYPFLLTLQPLVGALAAGNTAIVKPSSLNPETAKLIKKICEENFTEDYVKVYEGSTEVTNVLLEESFDHIFFTGSPRVGRIIMAAAAKHLTPVTLELGGKSPTIVHKDANLTVAARRIAAGKFMNVGQTCVAPDHLFVHADIKDQFVAEMKKVIQEGYGDDTLNNPDIGRMINDKHFERVKDLIDPAKVVIGGQTEKSQLFIAPTLMDNVSMEDPIMQEEIFGPVLPVIEYKELNELFKEIKKLPKHPLALYIYTQSEEVERKVLDNTQSGGVCVNNAVMHVANHHLPFGGIGESGMGSYHGHKSFETFSHARAVLKTPVFPDIKLRYAPYKNKVNIMRKMMR
jgi:aldehyde dehydrogenase (NAD+)